MPAVSGIVSATINGQQINILEASWTPNSVKQEEYICLNGALPYPKINYTIGDITLKVVDDPLTPVSGYQNMTGATVQIVQINGKSILAANAFCVDVQTVNAEDATYELKFKSNDITEVAAQ